MRSDHTYKVTKLFGCWHEGKWIPLHCSFLTVLNESSLVMAFRLCPSDEESLICDLMEGILNTPDKILDSFPESISTDNIAREKNSLLKMLAKFDIKAMILQVRYFLSSYCMILLIAFFKQDIWHAEQRVIRMMPIQHPSFSLAKAHLTKIFRKAMDGRYENKQELAQSFKKWVTTWSSSENNDSATLIVFKYGTQIIFI